MLAAENYCECELSTKLAFLDTSCEISDGKLIVDLFRKETDRNQYLLTSSCHPTHVTNNIPYSLALRIVRICSLPETRNNRLLELKQLLLTRDYKAGMIDAAINKAKQIPREEALKKVVHSKTTDRAVFVVTYDPRLPDLASIVKKHWRVMVQDSYLAEVYPKPPLIAYKRQRNIKDLLVKAKVPPARQRRSLPGMHRCGNCPICPYIKTGKIINATASKYRVQITKHYDCQTENLCYLVNCKKCRIQYIGETDRTLQDRFSEHLGYVRNQKLEKATGYHFNQNGHQMSDMEVSVIETINNKDSQFRKQRETEWIEKFDSKHKGLNKKS